MTDSQEYRNRAEACRRMVESSPNPLDRKTFSQLAAIWLRLANELDTTRALIEHWGVKEDHRRRPEFHPTSECYQPTNQLHRRGHA